ncbi:LysR family transcriptional regulator [Pediococcus siamensis]|uniref:LysR family transcriptional regulator n=1 Tax=Pediococcus siamensis TaxID=381829 RepID=UPI0039A3B301
MNIRSLQYFHYLIDGHSFRQTARHFNVTQPTITAAVKRLEQEFGVQLLIRDANPAKWQPSKAGLILNQFAKRILIEATNAHQAIAKLPQKKLLLGCPQIVGNYYLPKLVAQLTTDHQMRHVEIIERDTATLVEKIQTNQVDLAFLSFLPSKLPQGIHLIQVTASPFRVVLNPAHPLAHAKALAYADLASTPAVLFDSGQAHSQAFAWFTHQQPANVLYKGSDLNLILQMVHNHRAFAFLTALAIPDQTDLIPVPLKDPKAPVLSIYLALKPEKRSDPQIQELLTVIKRLTD